MSNAALNVALNIKLNKLGDGGKRAEAELKRLRETARTATSGGSSGLTRHLSTAAEAASKTSRNLRGVDEQMRKLGRFGDGGLPMNMKALADHAARLEKHLTGAAKAEEKLRSGAGARPATPAPATPGRPHPPGSSRTAILAPGYIAPAAGAYGAKRMLDQPISLEKAEAEFDKKVGIKDPAERARMLAIARSMAIQYGISRPEMVGMFAEAGASGIDAADLVRFNKLAISSAVGWDMPARETAKAFAEIKAGMALTIPQMEILANKINAVGDNSAARESDIVSMYQKAAPGSEFSGLDENMILAMLAGVRSSGMQPEVVSRWLGNLVATLRAAEYEPKRVAAGLKKIGFTPKGVAKGMATDARGTLMEVFDRIGKSDNKVGILNQLFGREWWDETARAARGIGEIRKQLEFLDDPKNYEGSLDRGLKLQLDTTASHIDRFKALMSELSDRLTRWTLPGINKAIDETIAGVERADKAAEEGRPGVGAALPGLGPDLARDLVRRKQEAVDAAAAAVDELESRRTATEEQRGRFQGALGNLPPGSGPIRKGTERQIRDLTGDLVALDGKLSEARARLEEAGRELDRVKGENAEFLSPDLGPAAQRSMEQYQQALQAGGAKALAIAQHIAAQLQGALGFTATPTISPRFQGGGPATGAPGGSGPGGIGKSTGLGGGTRVQVTQHISGGASPAAVAARAQREQNRAVRAAQARALHDLGSWA